jgi:hypothetical protein
MLTPHPSGNNEPPLILGPRKGRTSKRLDQISTERARDNPNKLAARMTKFTTNFTGQVRVPKVIDARDKYSSADQVDGAKCIEVGQIPED